MEHIKHHIFFRIIAATLIFTFALYDITWAQGGTPIWADIKSQTQSVTVQGAKQNRTDIVIPSETGKVSSSSIHNKGDDLIINIQDAHASLSAQESIVKMLDSLATNYDLDLVAVEGSQGYVDTSILKTFPDENIKKMAAGSLMESGRMSAGEFFAITSKKDIALYGIEDGLLYKNNLELLKSVLNNSQDAVRSLNSLSRMLTRIEDKAYSPKLKKFLDVSRMHKDGKTGFADYWNYVSSVAAENGVDSGKFINISKMLSSVETEKIINFDRANDERKALIDQLSKRMPKDELERLVLNSVDFKAGKLSQGSFHSYIAELAQKYYVDPAPYKNLINFAKYVSVYETIDLVALHHEFNSFEDVIIGKLIESDGEKSLRKLVDRTRILRELFDISLSNNDITYLVKNKGEFTFEAFQAATSNLSSIYGVRMDRNIDLKKVFDKTGEAIKFYNVTQERNEAMLRNTVRRMKEEKKHVAALVTGGFHSQGISELMKEQKLSYMVIMPKFEAGRDRPYLAILTKKRAPYEALIKSGEYKLAVYQFFSTGDMNDLAYAIAIIFKMLPAEDLGSRRTEWNENYRKSYEELAKTRADAVSAPRLTPDEFKAFLDLFTPEAIARINAISKTDLDGAKVLEIVGYGNKVAGQFGQLSVEKPKVSSPEIITKDEITEFEEAEAPKLDLSDIGSKTTHTSEYRDQHTRVRIENDLDVGGRFLKIGYSSERGEFLLVKQGVNASSVDHGLMSRLPLLVKEQNLKAYIAEHGEALANLKIYLLEPEKGSRAEKHPHLLTARGNNQFEVAHSGVILGSEPAVYMTRAFFEDVSVKLLADVLLNQIKVAMARQQAWHTTLPAPIGDINSENTARIISQLMSIRTSQLRIKDELASLSRHDMAISEKYAIDKDIGGQIEGLAEKMTAKMPEFAPAVTIHDHAVNFRKALEDFNYDEAVYWWGLITYEFKQLSTEHEQLPGQMLSLPEVKIFLSVAAAINEILNTYILEYGIYNKNGHEAGEAAGTVRVIEDLDKIEDAFEHAEGDEIWVIPYLPTNRPDIPGKACIISIEGNRHAIDTAKEQGTPLAVIPNAVELLKGFNGKRGMLKVDKDSDVWFRLAIEGEMTPDVKRDKMPVKVPQANIGKKFIYKLRDVDEYTINYVGSKAANLGKMMNAGLKVPEGFALSFRFWHEFAIYNDIYTKIENLRKKIRAEGPHGVFRTHDMEAGLSDIKRVILEGEFPESLRSELLPEMKALRAKYGSVSFYVRSSFNFEDLTEKRTAGHYDSYPDQTFPDTSTDENIMTAIKMVFASMWNEEAFRARIENNIKDEYVMPSVIIQAPVEAKFAGNMYTANTVSYSFGEMTLMASHGQGAAVVGGHGRPAQILVDKITGQMQSVQGESLVDEEFTFVDGKLEARVVSAAERKTNIFSPKVVEMLTVYGGRIESLFNFRPQDIEWCFGSDGLFWFVQTRPMKTEQLPSDKFIDDLLLDNLVSVNEDALNELMEARHGMDPDALFRYLHLDVPFDNMRGNAGFMGERAIASKYLELLAGDSSFVNKIDAAHIQKLSGFLKTGRNISEPLSAPSLVAFIRKAGDIGKDDPVRAEARKFFTYYSTMNTRHLYHTINSELVKGLIQYQMYGDAVKKLRSGKEVGHIPDISDMTIRLLKTIPTEASLDMLKAFADNEKAPDWIRESAMRATYSVQAKMKRMGTDQYIKKSVGEKQKPRDFTKRPHAFRALSGWSFMGLGGGIDWAAIFGTATASSIYYTATNWSNISTVSAGGMAILAIITLIFAVTSFIRTVATYRAIRSVRPTFSRWQVMRHDIGHDTRALAALRDISSNIYDSIDYHESFKTHFYGLTAFIPFMRFIKQYFVRKGLIVLRDEYWVPRLHKIFAEVNNEGLESTGNTGYDRILSEAYSMIRDEGLLTSEQLSIIAGKFKVVIVENNNYIADAFLDRKNDKWIVSVNKFMLDHYREHPVEFKTKLAYMMARQFDYMLFRRFAAEQHIQPALSMAEKTTINLLSDSYRINSRRTDCGNLLRFHDLMRSIDRNMKHFVFEDHYREILESIYNREFIGVNAGEPAWLKKIIKFYRENEDYYGIKWYEHLDSTITALDPKLISRYMRLYEDNIAYWLKHQVRGDHIPLFLPDGAAAPLYYDNSTELYTREELRDRLLADNAVFLQNTILEIHGKSLNIKEIKEVFIRYLASGGFKDAFYCSVVTATGPYEFVLLLPKRTPAYGNVAASDRESLVTDSKEIGLLRRAGAQFALHAPKMGAAIYDDAGNVKQMSVSYAGQSIGDLAGKKNTKLNRQAISQFMRATLEAYVASAFRVNGYFKVADWKPDNAATLDWNISIIDYGIYMPGDRRTFLVRMLNHIKISNTIMDPDIAWCLVNKEEADHQYDPQILNTFSAFMDVFSDYAGPEISASDPSYRAALGIDLLRSMCEDSGAAIEDVIFLNFPLDVFFHSEAGNQGRLDSMVKRSLEKYIKVLLTDYKPIYFLGNKSLIEDFDWTIVQSRYETIDEKNADIDFSDKRLVGGHVTNPYWYIARNAGLDEKTKTLDDDMLPEDMLKLLETILMDHIAVPSDEYLAILKKLAGMMRVSTQPLSSKTMYRAFIRTLEDQVTLRAGANILSDVAATPDPKLDGDMILGLSRSQVARMINKVLFLPSTFKPVFNNIHIALRKEEVVLLKAREWVKDKQKENEELARSIKRACSKFIKYGKTVKEEDLNVDEASKHDIEAFARLVVDKAVTNGATRLIARHSEDVEALIEYAKNAGFLISIEGPSSDETSAKEYDSQSRTATHAFRALSAWSLIGLGGGVDWVVLWFGLDAYLAHSIASNWSNLSVTAVGWTMALAIVTLAFGVTSFIRAFRMIEAISFAHPDMSIWSAITKDIGRDNRALVKLKEISPDSFDSITDHESYKNHVIGLLSFIPGSKYIKEIAIMLGIKISTSGYLIPAFSKLYPSIGADGLIEKTGDPVYDKALNDAISLVKERGFLTAEQFKLLSGNVVLEIDENRENLADVFLNPQSNKWVVTINKFLLDKYSANPGVFKTKIAYLLTRQLDYILFRNFARKQQLDPAPSMAEKTTINLLRDTSRVNSHKDDCEKLLEFHSIMRSIPGSKKSFRFEDHYQRLLKSIQDNKFYGITFVGQPAWLDSIVTFYRRNKVYYGEKWYQRGDSAVVGLDSKRILKYLRWYENNIDYWLKYQVQNDSVQLAPLSGYQIPIYYNNSNKNYKIDELRDRMMPDGNKNFLRDTLVSLYGKSINIGDIREVFIRYLGSGQFKDVFYYSVVTNNGPYEFVMLFPKRYDAFQNTPARDRKSLVRDEEEIRMLKWASIQYPSHSPRIGAIIQDDAGHIKQMSVSYAGKAIGGPDHKGGLINADNRKLTNEAKLEFLRATIAVYLGSVFRMPGYLNISDWKPENAASLDWNINIVDFGVYLKNDRRLHIPRMLDEISGDGSAAPLWDIKDIGFNKDYIRIAAICNAFIDVFANYQGPETDASDLSYRVALGIDLLRTAYEQPFKRFDKEKVRTATLDKDGDEVIKERLEEKGVLADDILKIYEQKLRAQLTGYSPSYVIASQTLIEDFDWTHVGDRYAKIDAENASVNFSDQAIVEKSKYPANPYWYIGQNAGLKEDAGILNDEMHPNQMQKLLDFILMDHIAVPSDEYLVILKKMAGILDVTTEPPSSKIAYRALIRTLRDQVGSIILAKPLVPQIAAIDLNVDGDMILGLSRSQIGRVIERIRYLPADHKMTLDNIHIAFRKEEVILLRAREWAKENLNKDDELARSIDKACAKFIKRGRTVTQEDLDLEHKNVDILAKLAVDKAVSLGATNLILDKELFVERATAYAKEKGFLINVRETASDEDSGPESSFAPEPATHAFKIASGYSLALLGGGLDWAVLSVSALSVMTLYLTHIKLSDVSIAGLIAGLIASLFIVAMAYTSIFRVISSYRAIEQAHPKFSFWNIITHDIGHDERALEILRASNGRVWYQIVMHETFSNHILGLTAFLPSYVSKEMINNLEAQMFNPLIPKSASAIDRVNAIVRINSLNSRNGLAPLGINDPDRASDIQEALKESPESDIRFVDLLSDGGKKNYYCVVEAERNKRKVATAVRIKYFGCADGSKDPYDLRRGSDAHLILDHIFTHPMFNLKVNRIVVTIPNDNQALMSLFTGLVSKLELPYRTLVSEDKDQNSTTITYTYDQKRPGGVVLSEESQAMNAFEKTALIYTIDLINNEKGLTPLGLNDPNRDEDIRDSMKADSSQHLSCLIHGEYMYYMIAEIADREMSIRYLGIGTGAQNPYDPSDPDNEAVDRLLNNIFNRARQLGCVRVTAVVPSDNVPLIAMFRWLQGKGPRCSETPAKDGILFSYDLLTNVSAVLKAQRTGVFEEPVLDDIYLSMYDRFQGLEDLNMKELNRLASGFEKNEDDSFVTDELGRPVPVKSDDYHALIERSQLSDKAVRTLSMMRDEVASKLSKIPHYSVDNDEFHITLAVLHENLPFDKSPVNLTPHELNQFTEIFKSVANGHSSFRIRLEGLRIGADGGVIAIWKDSGEINEIRRNFYRKAGMAVEADKLANKKGRATIHTTLLRILGKIDPEILAELKSVARKYKDVSSSNIIVDIDKIYMEHQSQWLVPDGNHIVGTVELKKPHAFKIASSWSFLGLGGGIDWAVLFAAISSALWTLVLYGDQKMAADWFIMFCTLGVLTAWTAFSTILRIVHVYKAISDTHYDMGFWQKLRTNIGSDAKALENLKDISTHSWYQVQYHELFKNHVTGLFAFLPGALMWPSVMKRVDEIEEARKLRDAAKSLYDISMAIIRLKSRRAPESDIKIAEAKAMELREKENAEKTALLDNLAKSIDRAMLSAEVEDIIIGLSRANAPDWLMELAEQKLEALSRAEYGQKMTKAPGKGSIVIGVPRSTNKLEINIRLDNKGHKDAVSGKAAALEMQARKMWAENHSIQALISNAAKSIPEDVSVLFFDDLGNEEANLRFVEQVAKERGATLGLALDSNVVFDTHIYKLELEEKMKNLLLTVSGNIFSLSNPNISSLDATRAKMMDRAELVKLEEALSPLLPLIASKKLVEKDIYNLRMESMVRQIPQMGREDLGRAMKSIASQKRKILSVRVESLGELKLLAEAHRMKMKAGRYEAKQPIPLELQVRIAVGLADKARIEASLPKILADMDIEDILEPDSIEVLSREEANAKTVSGIVDSLRGKGFANNSIAVVERSKPDRQEQDMPPEGVLFMEYEDDVLTPYHYDAAIEAMSKPDMPLLSDRYKSWLRIRPMQKVDLEQLRKETERYQAVMMSA